VPTNTSVRDKVERSHTIIDLIKQKKLKLLGHICRIKDQRLVKTVMLGMVEGDRPRETPRRWCDDIADWCVDVQSQRWYDWQTTEKSEDDSLASTAHTGQEF